MNKGTNTIKQAPKLATLLLFLSMYFSDTAAALAQPTVQWNNPNITSTIIPNERTLPAAATMIYNTDINIAGGDPDKIFTIGIQKAIDDLAAKGNTEIKRNIPSELVAKIGIELASYIDSNFPDLKDNFPTSTISITGSILNEITIEFTVGNVKKIISIRVMGSQASPVIIISSAGKEDKQIVFSNSPSAPAAYNFPENPLGNTNNKVHIVAKGEYLQSYILPSMGFSNVAFMRIAAIGIDSVYGAGNMQIGTIIQLMDGSNEANEDTNEGRWVFTVSGPNASGDMIHKTVTIIGKRERITIRGKTTHKLVFTYSIVDNNPSQASRPVTYDQELRNGGFGQEISPIPVYTFQEGSGSGITEALKSNIFNGKINPVLASRAGKAMQTALNMANNSTGTPISDGNTLTHNPNDRTITLSSQGSIIILSYDGDIVTGITTQTTIPTAYSNASAGAENIVEIDDQGKANIGKNGIGYSLKACLAQDGNGSINPDVIGTNVARFIDRDLKARIFTNGGSLQAGSKVYTQWKFRDTVNVIIEYKKPILSGEKLTGYQKNITSSTYQVTIDENGDIVSITFLK